MSKHFCTIKKEYSNGSKPNCAWHFSEWLRSTSGEKVRQFCWWRSRKIILTQVKKNSFFLIHSLSTWNFKIKNTEKKENYFSCYGRNSLCQALPLQGMTCVSYEETVTIWMSAFIQYSPEYKRSQISMNCGNCVLNSLARQTFKNKLMAYITKFLSFFSISLYR